MRKYQSIYQSSCPILSQCKNLTLMAIVAFFLSDIPLVYADENMSPDDVAQNISPPDWDSWLNAGGNDQSAKQDKEKIKPTIPYPIGMMHVYIHDTSRPFDSVEAQDSPSAFVHPSTNNNFISTTRPAGALDIIAPRVCRNANGFVTAARDNTTTACPAGTTADDRATATIRQNLGIRKIDDPVRGTTRTIVADVFYPADPNATAGLDYVACTSANIPCHAKVGDIFSNRCTNAALCNTAHEYSDVATDVSGTNKTTSLAFDFFITNSNSNNVPPTTVPEPTRTNAIITLYTAFSGTSATVYPSTYMNVPIAKHGNKFPLVVYSPGSGNSRSNQLLAMNLAQRGYVVVIIGHTNEGNGNSREQSGLDPDFSSYNPGLMIDGKSILWPEGRYLRTKPTVPANPITGLTSDFNFEERVQDVRATIDYMMSMNSNLFKDRIDMHRIAVTGQSLGAATALFSGRKFNDIKALVAISTIPISDFRLPGINNSNPPVNCRVVIPNYTDLNSMLYPSLSVLPLAPTTAPYQIGLFNKPTMVINADQDNTVITAAQTISTGFGGVNGLPPGTCPEFGVPPPSPQDGCTTTSSCPQFGAAFPALRDQFLESTMPAVFVQVANSDHVIGNVGPGYQFPSLFVPVAQSACPTPTLFTRCRTKPRPNANFPGFPFPASDPINTYLVQNLRLNGEMSVELISAFLNLQLKGELCSPNEDKTLMDDLGASVFIPASCNNIARLQNRCDPSKPNYSNVGFLSKDLNLIQGNDDNSGNDKANRICK